MTLSRRSPTLESIAPGYFLKRRVVAPRVEQRALAANLAPEILLQVFSYLRTSSAVGPAEASARRRARASAPLVCRAWSSAATAALYHSVDLQTTEQATLFLRTICAQPKTRSSVRVLSLPACSSTSNPRGAHHRVAQCPMAEVYTTILRLLHCLKGLSIPDLHAAPDAVSHLGVGVLSLDCSFGGCTAAEHTSLLSSPAVLKTVSELSLTGTPFTLPGSRAAHLPALRTLHLTRVHSGADDLRALVACAPALRVLRATRVRVHAGLGNPVCGGVQLHDWAAPCARSLRELLACDTPLGGLSGFRKLEKLVIDDRARPTSLPVDLRQLGFVVSEAPSEDVLRNALDALPVLQSVHLTCSAPSARRAAPPLHAVCAKRGVRFELDITAGGQSRHVVEKRPALEHRQSWSTRNLFNPMRRALKAL